MPMHRRTVAALCATLVAFPAATAAQDVGAPPDHGWRRGAVCYEIFVRSFYDSDGDGVGDLNGLIQKLDYINDGDPDSQRDLGARCIWLMPVTQSPSYHGYDVTNYYHVERDYGTNDDFKRLIGEAHRRGIRVLVDLVLNHASSEHPYFKDALLNPGSPYRDWFVWSVTDPGIQGPWGQQVWHRAPGREEYYYGLFWGGMPDLNYETPAVRTEAQELATFWLMEMGADGFRLDAIKHLVEEDYGRVAEHVPATHEFLREFAAHIRRVAPDAFTIGEVWDSIGAMLPYYPDQLDAYFAFEASDAILESVRTASAKVLLRPFLRLQREAWWKRRPRQAGGHLLAHAARSALRLLRGGDRHDRQQAGPALTDAHAMEQRAGRRLHRRHGVGASPAGLAHRERGSAGGRPQLAAQLVPPPHPPTRGESGAPHR
jgi:glycosidase